eukprot:scaffold1859_cov103-Isochrysis_galbana.AAC.4
MSGRVVHQPLQLHQTGCGCVGAVPHLRVHFMHHLRDGGGVHVVQVGAALAHLLVLLHGALHRGCHELELVEQLHNLQRVVARTARDAEHARLAATRPRRVRHSGGAQPRLSSSDPTCRKPFLFHPPLADNPPPRAKGGLPRPRSSGGAPHLRQSLRVVQLRVGHRVHHREPLLDAGAALVKVETRHA